MLNFNHQRNDIIFYHIYGINNLFVHMVFDLTAITTKAWSADVVDLIQSTEEGEVYL